MDYKNLTIIGTSHIAKESINEIEDFIEGNKPDLVALELDRARFQSLLSKTKPKIDLSSIAKVGLNGFLFLVFGQLAQRIMGKMVGVKPGSEMLAAIKSARKRGIMIVLIDQDIEITLKRFSKALTIKERFRIVWDLLFGSIFRKNELKAIGIDGLDLHKVPSQKDINKMMVVVRQRYPGIYRVLVEERNVYMARNLANLLESNPDKKILAVVGAGHEQEILELVKLYSGESQRIVVSSSAS